MDRRRCTSEKPSATALIRKRIMERRVPYLRRKDTPPFNLWESLGRIRERLCAPCPVPLSSPIVTGMIQCQNLFCSHFNCTFCFLTLFHGFLSSFQFDFFLPRFFFQRSRPTGTRLFRRGTSLRGRQRRDGRRLNGRCYAVLMINRAETNQAHTSIFFNRK